MYRKFICIVKCEEKPRVGHTERQRKLTVVWCDWDEGMERHREPAGGSRELQGILGRSRFVPGELELEERRGRGGKEREREIQNANFN